MQLQLPIRTERIVAPLFLGASLKQFVMPSFSQSMREFRAGTCTEQELLQALDGSLATQRVQANALLQIIEHHHTQEPLPAELLRKLNARLELSVAEQNSQANTQDPSSETNYADSEHTRLATQLAGHDPLHDPLEEAEKTRLAPDDLKAVLQESTDQTPAIGTVLNNRFVLEEMVGQGGMSLVYRATDKRKVEARARNTDIAVKILDVSAKNEGPAFMALQREVQKSETLHHPNVVRAYDFDRDGDIVFMTMEFLTGRSLAAEIKDLNQQGMDLGNAMRMIRQMGGALAHAHSHRIVHADFKPGNVMLTVDNQIKVIDFGIARAYKAPEDSEADKTLFDPRALGALTPAYASPEMLENLEPDPRDDIYSLGCVAYELITGVHPFSKTRATDARNAGLKPTKPNNLSRRQWRALAKALNFDRLQRSASVDELLSGLVPQKVNYLSIAGIAGAGLMIGALAYLLLPKLNSETFVEQPQATSITSPTNTATTTARPEPAEPAYRPGVPFQDCATCPPMIPLAAGVGIIGSPQSEAMRRDFEGPQVEITLADNLAIGVNEVTVGEFRAYVTATNPNLAGCRNQRQDWRVDPDLAWDRPGFKQTDAHPVSCVSWQDAQGYIAWLGKQTGALYRLPSEAEWEFAARGGASNSPSLSTAWGELGHQACRYANIADQSASRQTDNWQTLECNDGYVHTAPVGQRQANALGLHDMQGNLFEWTQDCWSNSYIGTIKPALAGQCNLRVLRGGSWHTAPGELRFAFRNRAELTTRSQSFGFRVVRELP